MAKRGFARGWALPWLAIIITSSGTHGRNQPNVVLLLTDDQDNVFNSFGTAMPFTKKFLKHGGVSFVNAFSHTPLCCPSRGQILTGKYLHNLKAADPDAVSCMRMEASKAFEQAVFANQLQASGYETGMIGKYLNGKYVSHCDPEGERAPPPGWDFYFAM